MDHDAVYYRVFRSKNNEIVYPTMQWFDEYDYDQSRFLTEEKFESEEAARAWVREASRVVEILWDADEGVAVVGENVEIQFIECSDLLDLVKYLNSCGIHVRVRDHDQGTEKDYAV